MPVDGQDMFSIGIRRENCNPPLFFCSSSFLSARGLSDEFIDSGVWCENSEFERHIASMGSEHGDRHSEHGDTQ